MQQADLLRIRGRAQRHAAGALFTLLCVATPAPAPAQQPDTIRPVELAPVVVTGERVRTPLASSTTAVAKLAGEDLRARPVRSVAEALAAVPGLSFLDVDGLGLDPQLTLRGFYGGGEAEYVVVLLDGKPLNGLEAGLFDWDLVPLSSLESIEVVRGGTSSLYGDAAVGGVINLVTRAGGHRGGRLSAGGGELGLLRGSLDLGTSWGDRPVSVFGAFRRADGFREHAARSAGSAGASLGLWRGAAGELSASTLSHWRSYEEPGPLTAPELATSRTAVHPFYRFDTGDEWLHRLTLDARSSLLGGGEAAGYLAGELRSLDGVRTLPLSPAFADTKERVLHTSRLLGSAQVRWSEGVLPAPGALLVGVDGSAGRLRNEHYQVVAGDRGAYQVAAGGRGVLSARGEGERLGLATFARYEVRPAGAVRLTAGGRLDWLRDTFRAGLPATAADHENTHVAFSPQAGVNVRYLANARQEGHVFANLGRSFKAPTPDQLFDQRSIPIPFDPFELTLSNPELEPARGSSIEAGLYQQAQLIPDALDGALSLAAYQLDMENELDVDLQSFRYVNIGKSRHRGVEAGVQLEGPGRVGAYGSYTLQDVVFRFGEYEGNALKAIPRHSLSAGVRAGGRSGLAGSMSAHSAWGCWLDDANTIELPGYTRLDGRLSYALSRVRLELEVFNLLDREYSTTGYPDPAGSGTVYYYPAAGRVLQVGLSADW